MKVKTYGVLSMIHEARTDLAMWFGLLFLILSGPGLFSIDATRGTKPSEPSGKTSKGA